MHQGQNDSGGWGGCVVLILVILAVGGGWYFAVKENRNFMGAEAIRTAANAVQTAWALVFPGQPDLDREYVETEILRQINVQREQDGLKPLIWDDRLAEIALAHSRDMAENGYYPLNHRNLLGETPTERARKAGYQCRKRRSIGVAENAMLAHRYGEHREELRWHMETHPWYTEDELASAIVLSWQNSPGHYENYMSDRYTLTGVGVAFGVVGPNAHAVLVVHKFC